jgi:hypothetical protein
MWVVIDNEDYLCDFNVVMSNREEILKGLFVAGDCSPREGGVS